MGIREESETGAATRHDTTPVTEGGPAVPAVRRKMLFTEKEAADILGVKSRQLIDLRRRKEIGYIRVGRLVRYRRSDMEKFVEDNAIHPRR